MDPRTLLQLDERQAVLLGALSLVVVARVEVVVSMSVVVAVWVVVAVALAAVEVVDEQPSESDLRGCYYHEEISPRACPKGSPGARRMGYTEGIPQGIPPGPPWWMGGGPLGQSPVGMLLLLLLLLLLLP